MASSENDGEMREAAAQLHKGAQLSTPVSRTVHIRVRLQTPLRRHRPQQRFVHYVTGEFFRVVSMTKPRR